MPLCSGRVSVLDVAAAGVAFDGIDVAAAFKLFAVVVVSDVDATFVADVVVVVVAVELSMIADCSSAALLLTELDVAFAVELFKLVILSVCFCVWCECKFRFSEVVF